MRFFKSILSLRNAFITFTIFALLTLIVEISLILQGQRSYKSLPHGSIIRDFENAFCNRNESLERLQSESQELKKCPKGGIVTCLSKGTVTETLWQYANVVGLSIFSGLDGYLPICTRQSMDYLFEEIPLPVLSEIGHCPQPFSRYASSSTDWYDKNQSIVVDNTHLCNDIAVRYLPKVREHLKFNVGLTGIASHYLRKAAGQRTNVSFVGVYMKRMKPVIDHEYDYEYPDVKFYLETMAYFRKKYSNTVFIVISDNRHFWRPFLRESDVYIIPEDRLNKIGAKFSLLSHCNHTILTSEGVPLWAAIMANGETILPSTYHNDCESLLEYYNGWKVWDTYKRDFLSNATASKSNTKIM